MHVFYDLLAWHTTPQTKEKDDQERISRHNRSAKPFTSFSPTTTETTEKKTNDAPKKSGFRSVSFNPKPSNNSSGDGAPRGQPDGGPIVAPNGGQSAVSDLPSPPPDFVVAPATDQPSQTAQGYSAPKGNKRVLGPNVAVGLYSNANVQDAYKAQVESEDL